MKILGIRVDNYSKLETLQKVDEFFGSSKQNKIFTPNPEMLVDAQKDEYFKKVLNSGELNVCDGFGLALVGKLHRYAGVDLLLDICKLAEAKNKSVFLLGSGSDEVLEKTKENLLKQFPKLQTVGWDKGGKLQIVDFRLQVDNNENEKIVSDINSLTPDILFVAFGHSKQEKWIHENLAKMPSVKIAMGVGGSFDYISGKIKRAPRLMRKFGLEWIYRLIKEPKRIGRIFKATFVFLWLYLTKYD
ncbi:MAG: Glycosyl transferase, WecB/TagA/CpsF family [Candidatus Magasanikbacteria bacterium GW2011_GWA2_37_8]|uniref:Glycosyl transferase, WecB/TagA/CpsF family n=1 Tax=Candidatus Magasanikbacteria bacterium GW2011_GWA2_37_8 TaxID=1619036 RepID=A0A0G0JWE8_9BACT|nr:MAG: Glycosyl transferase, WecB/TagA/CpsF family [Candidatus Magasanikbacteria bacterium GW2011_GWA2_37_8]